MRLMELHIVYEKQPEYPLEEIESPTAEVTFRLYPHEAVQRTNPNFATTNSSPCAASPPPPSTPAWATAPPSSGSSTSTASPPTPAPAWTNDPNCPDDPHYILRLIGQVITVSLETQQIIAALPPLNLAT